MTSSRGVLARTRLRMIVAFAVGVATGIVLSFFMHLTYAIVAGWAAACVVYIAWVWIVVWGFDAAQTRAHATREEPGKPTSDLLVLIASAAAVVAIVFILVQAHAAHGADKAGLASLAFVTVALSWFLVHTLYMLRYADLYYSRPNGGIDFNQKEPPTYIEFAYLAFTLGMTFQVSDTDISSSLIRRTILRHTLLSYLYGSVILGTTVNLVAGLSQ